MFAVSRWRQSFTSPASTLNLSNALKMPSLCWHPSILSVPWSLCPLNASSCCPQKHDCFHYWSKLGPVFFHLMLTRRIQQIENIFILLCKSSQKLMSSFTTSIVIILACVLFEVSTSIFKPTQWFRYKPKKLLSSNVFWTKQCTIHTVDTLLTWTVDKKIPCLQPGTLERPIMPTLLNYSREFIISNRYPMIVQ